MAKYRIETPDKKAFEVEAPDDYTPEQVNQLVRQQLGDQFANSPFENRPAPKAPEADPEQALFQDIGTGVKEIGTGVLEGGANVLDHAADWLQSGLNLAGGLGDEINSAWGDGQNDLTSAVPAATPGLETLRGAGRFVGEAVATAPVAALRGGALAQGAVSGALLSNNNDLVGVGLDAAAGAAGGYAGSKLLGAAAGLAKPEPVSPELRTLMNEGIRVDPGQVARSRGTAAGDRVAARIDRSTSAPFVGDAITADRQGSFSGFARATINRAVKPIGLELPDEVPAGRKAVAWAGDKLSAKYDELLPKLRVSGDDQFLSDLANVHSEAQTLHPQRVAQFNNELKALGRFWQGGENLTGQALKNVDERLSARIRRLSASQDADQQDLGDAFQAVRDAVHELAARQNPQYAGDLQAINKGWKGLVQVEKASANSKAQITPAGYSQAVKQTSDTVRRRGYARGEALNQDLADAASDILPSEYPDSGTAGRWMEVNKSARIKGGIDLLRYRAAQAMQPAYLRTDNIHPNLAKLLQAGAVAAPQLATAGITELRR
jgi:hypothetical protein